MTKHLLLSIAAVSLCLGLPTDASAKGKKGKKAEALAKQADPAAAAAQNHPRKIVKQYDANNNGYIDGAEIETVRKAYESNKTGDLKQFDADNDGKLDDTEIGSMKIGKKGGKGGGKAKGAKKKGATTTPATTTPAITTPAS